MFMLFANKIKALREKQQLLQHQMATGLEIDTPMLSKTERGYPDIVVHLPFARWFGFGLNTKSNLRR